MSESLSRQPVFLLITSLSAQLLLSTHCVCVCVRLSSLSLSLSPRPEENTKRSLSGQINSGFCPQAIKFAANGQIDSLKEQLLLLKEKANLHKSKIVCLGKHLLPNAFCWS